MFDDLKGKKILVTGATRGIGRAVAVALAREGAHLIFNYRAGKKEVARVMEEELLALGAQRVDSLPFDVTKSDQLSETLGPFVKEEGPITGLVNNAGISGDQILLRLKERDLRNILETNLLGSIMTASVLARGFLRSRGSSVVNISSVAGLMGNSGQVAYASSKAGLIGFTKSLAREMASKGLRCNAVCPGFIETDMTESLDQKVREGYLGHIPLERFGQASEVAKLVLFLLSDASSYITGEVIKIDGGLYT